MKIKAEVKELLFLFFLAAGAVCLAAGIGIER